MCARQIAEHRAALADTNGACFWGDQVMGKALFPLPFRASGERVVSATGTLSVI
jgi:hypothetical protein